MSAGIVGRKVNIRIYAGGKCVFGASSYSEQKGINCMSVMGPTLHALMWKRKKACNKKKQ
jgi:hypothetical protein